VQAALVLRGDAEAVAKQLAAALPAKLNRERVSQWADGLRQQVRRQLAATPQSKRSLLLQCKASGTALVLKQQSAAVGALINTSARTPGMYDG
jgi:hypothetical protein